MSDSEPPRRPARLRRMVVAFAPAALAVAFLAALIGAREAGLLEPAELFAYDVQLRLREAPPAPPGVAIIAVDDAALDQWGWPVPDDNLAALIEMAAGSGAAAIALDIYRDRPVPPGHERLLESFAASPVFGAMKFGTGGDAAVAPPPALKALNRYGVVDFPVDEDGVMRRALLYVDDGATAYQGLALAAAMHVLGERGIAPAADPADPSAMRLGAARLRPLGARDGPYQAADSGGYQVLFDFRRGIDEVPVVPALDVVSGAADLSVFAGRIVFIGIASEVVKDLVVSPRAGDTASGLLNGVVLHAWLADQLIRFADGVARPLETLTPLAEIAIIVAAGFAGLALGLAVASPLALALAGLAVAAIAILGAQLLFAADIWVPVVPGTVAALGCLAIAVAGRVAAERRERIALMSLFSQQVSPEVAEELWRRRESILEQGLPRPLRLTATVIFMDLAGSTSIADRLDPETYMGWVGRFLERMADTAIAGGGLVDKYTGDGLMIVFGAPVPRTDPGSIDADARAAIDCALSMARELDAFNAAEAPSSGAEARMRIGIHTGPVFAGCVGARRRAQYTVMGATVNAAARLEGLKDPIEGENASAACRILLSETTANAARGQFALLGAGSVTLRGFSAPIRVYLVAGAAGEAAKEEVS